MIRGTSVGFSMIMMVLLAGSTILAATITGAPPEVFYGKFEESYEPNAPRL